MLTSFADGDHVTNALDAGASGYLLKDADPSVLVEAVRSVASGQSPLDPRVARTYLSTRRGGSIQPSKLLKEPADALQDGLGVIRVCLCQLNQRLKFDTPLPH